LEGLSPARFISSTYEIPFRVYAPPPLTVRSNSASRVAASVGVIPPAGGTISFPLYLNVGVGTPLPGVRLVTWPLDMLAVMRVHSGCQVGYTDTLAVINRRLDCKTT
jgi:hypothetical protein